MENTKQSSSWRGNSGKIIDFLYLFRKSGAGVCKTTALRRKNGNRRSVPLGETTTENLLFWGVGG
jgi:hypothetical protein